MINKNILTAGAFILSMLVLIAATNINSNEVILDPDRKALTGVVVDADSKEAVPNATVYLKKKNNDDGMQADRTQQQQQQQQQQDRAVGQEQDAIDETTTNQNGEFEFDNIEQLRAQLGNRDLVQERQHEQQQDQQQQQQQQALEGDDETVILVVEAPGYETAEKEIKLSEYLEDSADEQGAMERDQDSDQDRDHDRDKDNDKIKIELTRAN